MNQDQFFAGNAFDAYTYFGAHVQKDSVVFRVYAPNADAIYLIGEFNDWKELPEYEMKKGKWNTFTITRKDVKVGMKYKYKVHMSNGGVVDKTDPYAFGMELRPNSASIVTKYTDFKFTDRKWMASRTRNFDKALNIYEIHAGSWKKPEGKEQVPDAWLNYRELAAPLIKYLKDNHYTHVEMMPLNEHPFDGSWGYQVTGYFAPTARYGTATDLRYLINELHKAGLGAIIDFVPVHFATDYYSLNRFDGTAIYEYPEDDIGYSEWGTNNFNYYRGEAVSFLKSAANYWIKEYHFDGIRMDAISNVIYWAGNSARGENQGGIKFIRELNKGLHELHPTVMTIAEDSSSYPSVTKGFDENGLGFDYKWAMGWMNDTLKFFKYAPWDRSAHYHDLTFAMMYFYNENYICALSHDEVVHGKATILQKMWGDYDGKFAQGRLLYTYMYTHPGKKLNFMGNEFGQLREWDERRDQDWLLMLYPRHTQFHDFMVKLNEVYVSHPELYAEDFNSTGFLWLQVHGENEGVYIYRRQAGDKQLAIALNMKDVPYDNYNFELPAEIKGKVHLKEILNSADPAFGGWGSETRQKEFESDDKNLLTLNLPGYAAVIYEMVEDEPVEPVVDEKAEAAKKAADAVVSADKTEGAKAEAVEAKVK